MSELIHRTLTSDRDVHRLSRAVATASPNSYVAYDTETGSTPEQIQTFGDKATVFPYVSCYLTGISVCLVRPRSKPAERAEGFYVPVGHRSGNASPEATRELCQALSGTAARHVLHHACFDWAVLENAGLGFRHQREVIDTEVAHWLHDENMPKALKVLGEMYLNEDAGKEQRELKAAMLAPYATITDAKLAVAAAYPEEFKWSKAGNPNHPSEWAAAAMKELRRNRTWGDLTVAELGPYAANDATLTARFADDFLGRKRILHPERPLQREMDIQHVLFSMSKKGVSVDIGQLEAAGVDYAQRADALTVRYEEAYGTAMRKRFGRKGNDTFNIGSTDQVGWLLFEHIGLPVKLRTDGGNPATGKDALGMLEGNPVAAGILEYRRWVKARSSYAEPFARHAEWSADGRVHGHYSSTRTVTGRLSASGPNVMQIPRSNTLPEIRRAFYKTPKGIERIGFDLKSAELWVTASITKDPVLTEMLLTGANMHVAMMLEVFGGEPDKDRREYTIAKNVNYSMAYEAGLNPLMIYVAQGGYGPDEVERIARRCLDGHKRLFSRQHFVSEFLATKARERGRLPLHVPGRYRHFQTPGVAVAYYTGLNALVQGGIGEFMKDVMLEVDATEWGEALVLQVHDELVFDAPTGSRDAIHATLTEISHRINPFRYPLEWDAKGWAEEEAA